MREIPGTGGRDFLYNSGYSLNCIGAQLNGLIEAGNGMGQKGVLLEIAEQAGDAKKASSELTKTVKRTSDMGGITAKALNDGTYLITATKPGFVTQTMQVYVSGGEMTKVVIELEKS